MRITIISAIVSAYYPASPRVALPRKNVTSDYKDLSIISLEMDVTECWLVLIQIKTDDNNRTKQLT
jgi:hypothetical protein